MPALLSWLLLALLARRPSALRFVDGPAEDAESEELHVPAVPIYRRVWQERYALEERLDEAMPSSVNLVMGVMTIAKAKEHRDVMRETWVKQEGVCYWSFLPKKGCSVHVAFVMGSSSPTRWNVSSRAELAAHREPGALVLPDMQENMNFGKTPTFFAYALKHFPWATHIGKVDMDTYPFLHKLVFRMSHNRTCVRGASPYEYIGRPGWHTVSPEPRPGQFASACERLACEGRFTGPLDQVAQGGPWRFMQGEMYVLSTPLVAAMRWEPWHGCEDIVVGTQIDEQMQAKGQCVVIRRLDAALHRHQRSVSREFANDF